MEKNFITVDINTVVPYENNPRNNARAVKPVMKSIKKVGYNTPIIVDENMVILAGHTRLDALKQLEEKEVQVLQVTGMTDEQKTKYRLYDNKTGELASWDYVALLEEVTSIEGMGGFDALELNWDLGTESLDEVMDEEELEEKEEKLKYECPHCGFRFNE